MTVGIQGHCDERFAPIKAAMPSIFDEGRDRGAPVGGVLGGELVVELWGGWQDWKRTRPWKRDTVVQVFSTSKVVLAFCVLMLVDRGQLELDAPVARYWPAFGEAGNPRNNTRVDEAYPRLVKFSDALRDILPTLKP